MQSIWVFIPALRQPPGFDLFVLLAGIALLLLRRSLRLGNRGKSRIDDQTATGRCFGGPGSEGIPQTSRRALQSLPFKQSVSEKGDSRAIWNAVHHTKPNKLLKGAPVIYLEFKLFNRKRKATPTLRLKSCWSTSILKRISGSILLCPALLMRITLVKQLTE